MTEQLPAIIEPGALADPIDTYRCQVPIANAGDQHPQRPHAPMHARAAGFSPDAMSVA